MSQKKKVESESPKDSDIEKPGENPPEHKIREAEARKSKVFGGDGKETLK